jgi:hypothetical protein
MSIENKNVIRHKQLICEHNRDKYRCKLCKGNGICEHNNEKYYVLEKVFVNIILEKITVKNVKVLVYVNMRK